MDTINRALLEDAIDEINELRRAAAHEVAATQAHATYATFPKSRVQPLAAQVEILTACAQGHPETATDSLKFAELTAALREAGARTTLTAPSWEAESPRRSRSALGEQVPLKAYSLALDQIWLTRRKLAYVAAVSRGHAALKSFPASRRRHLEAQIDRLSATARGDVRRAYAGISSRSLDHACREVGVTPLTADQWLELTPAGTAVR